jgi:hypothetical protein
MFYFRRIAIIYLAAFLITLGATSFAADDVVKGYLVDVACSARRARKPEPPTRHSRMCMQLPDCSNSGYGILTGEQRFIRFDEEGNQKAREFLAHTSQESDFKITATGSMQGDRFKVSRIELQ